MLYFREALLHFSEIKLYDWMFQDTWLLLTNNGALFQSSIVPLHLNSILGRISTINVVSNEGLWSSHYWHKLKSCRSNINKFFKTKIKIFLGGRNSGTVDKEVASNTRRPLVRIQSSAILLKLLFNIYSHEKTENDERTVHQKLT